MHVIEVSVSVADLILGAPTFTGTLDVPNFVLPDHIRDAEASSVGLCPCSNFIARLFLSTRDTNAVVQHDVDSETLTMVLRVAPTITANLRDGRPFLSDHPRHRDNMRALTARGHFSHDVVTTESTGPSPKRQSISDAIVSRRA